jgi:cytochrome c
MGTMEPKPEAFLMHKRVFSFLAALSLPVVSLAMFSWPALAQDVAAGEKVFLQCRACHQVGETARNATGPQLNGLFGRKAGSMESYTYSTAYKSLDKIWTEDTFISYIKDPRTVTPGTKMVYPGLKDEAKIRDLIAYLKQFDVSGKKVP